MTAWRAARCITTLREQVNAAHPGRPTASDGIIGDLRHQHETQSDHNPNEHGVVTAWDITTAPWSDALAERLRALGKASDGRVKYVICQRRIASSRDGWAWRPYSGTDPHTNHIHLSVSADPAQYDRTDPWPISTAHDDLKTHPTPEDDDMKPDERAALLEVRDLLRALVAPRRADHKDTDSAHLSLGDVITADEDAKKK